MISPESVLLRYRTRVAGVFERLVGRDPLENTLKDVSKDFNKAIPRTAPKIVNAIRSIAKQYGVSAEYLAHAIFSSRKTWPVRGYEAKALEVARDIVLKEGVAPDYGSPPEGEDEAKVDKAVKETAKWAAKTLAKELATDLYVAAAKAGKPARKKMNLDLTPMDMAKYLVVKMGERLKTTATIFQNHYLLDRIVNGLVIGT